MPDCYLGLASAAWLLADPLAQKLLLFYGVTPVSGSTSQVNTYQAKLYGLYSLFLALEQLCSCYHITKGGVLIGCNNKGAIHQVQAFHEYVPCNTCHADLLWAITTLQLCFPLCLRFIYVPGHQDAFTWFGDLPPHQRLNVWAESLAKWELHRLTSLPTGHNPMPLLLIGLFGLNAFGMLPLPRFLVIGCTHLICLHSFHLI